MDNNEKIPAERLKKLDSLFEAFSIIGDDTYVYLCDMKYDFSRWEKNLVDEFGLPGEYMFQAGEIWEEHIHEEDRKSFHEGIDDVFSGKSDGHDMQYRARRKDGGYDVCTCRGIILKDADGQPEYFGGAIRNHNQQSHVDTLTGLRNQYGFFEDLQRYINNNTTMRTFIVGIGKMTEINELYGYAVGNSVLQYFGRYLMDNVGDRGGTYRLDGAKFAIITETQSYDEIKNTYEIIRKRFRDSIKIHDKRIMLELNAATMMIDDFVTDNQTVYACLNFAYEDSKIKKHGDLVEFINNSEGDKISKTERLHVIRDSINQDFNGFYLVYQPVVDVETEKLKGVEALLRWRNDKYGVVPPDEFIPVLEGDPLFPKLGEWILQTALKDALEIQKIIPELSININLSYAQLEKADFTDTVLDIVDKMDFNPEKLCLEVTERCKLLDLDLLRNTMISLRSHGIHMALDDFGTGYSSVGILKNLSFDTIKIDKSFVQEIEEDEKARRLVNSILEMAVLYGTDVCVEGIETCGMCDILRGYEVNSFQGYYYSRPIEIEELMSKIKTEAGELCFSKTL
ncbi:MAG: GGDEF domain-containing phosphodiesterase [Lachnospiraceae bacterium]|nr:GGDEF domain-containing phosphodiesterase [Lachnospiraceae bacterium]